MRVKINSGRIKLNGGRLKYNYPPESKNYVDKIQSDVALTATQRLYAHFMVGVDINQSIWSLRKAYYLFLGGTASTHKWNAKDLRDLDAAFRLTYVGTISHTSDGVQNETGTDNNFIKTAFSPNAELTPTDTSLSVYSNQENSINTFNFGFPCEIGSREDPNINGFRIFIKTTIPNTYCSFGRNASVVNIELINNSSVSPRFVSQSFKSGNSYALLFNKIASIGSTIPNSLPSSEVKILTDGTSSALSTLPSSRKVQLASIGVGFTPQQMITDANKTIFGQKILGRA